ncbi:MAG: alanine--tRNA ligase-related protein, partial [Promethearchaeota archaeon]
MQKIYLIDPYVKELETEVLDTTEDAVLLEKIIIYPGGGGQPFDHGKIDKYEIKGIFEKKSLIWFKIGVHTLKKGQKVHTSIDWSRRFTLMRSHTSAHLFFQVLEEMYGSMKPIGSNIDIKRSRLEIDRADLTLEDAKKAEARVNEIINEKREVETRQQEDTGDCFAQISGYPEIACGGTHVKKTSDIGGFVVLKREKKGKERVR